MVEADGGEEIPRHPDRLGPRGIGQPAGIDEAAEALRAGIHLGMDDAQRPQLALEKIAVKVELQAVRGLFEQHAVGAAGLGQALLRDALEGLDQMPDDPQFPGAKVDQGVEFGAVAHRARQHREGRFYRLDEDRIGDVVGHSLAVARGHQPKAGVGFGRHLLQHAARVQLVLAGEHGMHRRPGPAHALGQQGGGQGAELLVVGRHRLPAGARRAAGEAVDEACQVEAGQACVAGKAEQVKAGMIVRELRGTATETQPVPVVVEQHQAARRRGAHALALSLRPRVSSLPSQGSRASASKEPSTCGECRSESSRTWPSSVPALT
jgi:hypothetical protein